MCYPFTSIDFIEKDLLNEYYSNHSVSFKMKQKQRILMNVVKYIQERYTIYSYDEIKMLLEKFLYYEKDYANSYEYTYDILKKLSTSLITKLDGRLVYKYWCNEHDIDVLGGFAEQNKLLLFHSFNRHIPMDLMSIIYMLENNADDIHQLHNFFGQISVADLQLYQQLEKGVAENHMHSGASMPFLSMWNLIMTPLTKSKEESFNRLVWKDTLYVNENKIWGYVLSAGILRVLISILHLLLQKYDDISNTDILNNSSNLTGFFKYYLHNDKTTNIYDILEQGDMKEIFSHMISLWDELSQFISINDDIMRTLYQVDKNIKTSEENIFLFYTLSYLRKGNNKNKEIIQQLFLQYIRIKNTFFNLLVQQKTIKGLDYFQSQYYFRNSKTINIIHNRFWDMVIREQFQNRNLRKIEFRMSVGMKESEFRRNIKSFFECYLDIIRTDYCIKENAQKYQVVRNFPRVGIVFSLLKREDTNPQEKCYIDGFVNAEKLQFRQLQNQYREQIDFIQKLRNESSEMSKYIVGLDAASLENATPVWVFSPIYEYARDSMKDPLIVGNSFYQSLNFTFHAGEDFRHILSGIRRIDEAVTHLKFHAGDRIGHGIALGLDVQNWYNENPVVVLPRIELLENYLWAYNTLSNAEQNLNSFIMSYMEKRIYDLSKVIYNTSKGIKTEVLIDAYLKMFHLEEELNCSEEKVHKVFCDKISKNHPDKAEIDWNTDTLCIARNCNYFTKQMNEPIHIRVTEQELDIAQQLQKIIRKKLSQMGIVLEINPSSNVSISSMDSLYENQIYSINNFMLDESNVMVCINSDDPSVFNTNVSNELAYIFNAILQKGISKEIAMQWIEKLRNNGMKSSFIRRNDTDQQVLDGLTKLVKEL